MLFFDEADAIFGKRSEVRDAHDRYANIESAYLLQRLETFDGLAVLATNLRANIDEAFTRRLDAIIDFPAPTPDLRRGPVAAVPRRRRCRWPTTSTSTFCAESFELAGGNIRSAADHRGLPRRRDGPAGGHGRTSSRPSSRSTASSAGWCSSGVRRYLSTVAGRTHERCQRLSRLPVRAPRAAPRARPAPPGRPARSAVRR